MKPRKYQIELYEKAKGENVIIKLNTGSGKTYIASMLIRDYLNVPDNKKIFLLVKNSSLAYQHFDYLKKYLFLNDEIGVFHGQMDNSWVDNWSKETWSEKLGKYKLIVMTAKVFLDILLHNKFSLKDVCYIIFDEVHHCAKSDDYAQISQCINRSRAVKVLGLTACLVHNVKKMSDIKYQMLDLERKLDCKIITSIDTIQSDFSGNIKDDIKTFEEDSLKKIKKIVRLFTNSIESMDSLSTKTQKNFLEVQNIMDYLQKYLRECLSVLKSLGLIPCKLILEIFLKDLEHVIFEYASDKKSLTRLNLFISCLKAAIDDINKLCEPDELNCSEKCKILLRFIYDFKKKTNNFETKTSILIFVSERIHALALNEFFSTLPEIDSEFSFISSQFIIGHSTTNYPRKLQMNSRKQNEILKQYREKKFNILIGTNVVEEGLDIPHCNVVIKFDPPQDFRSYVQSKGRARANDSSYMIFTSDENKTASQLKHFRQTNRKINEILQSKVVDCESDEDSLEDVRVNNGDSQFDYVPYGNDGPRITLNTASGVLNRYIGKLRCNALSVLKIVYKPIKTDTSFYQYSLLLPMPSPCADEIIGRLSSSKKRARQRASLKACRLLHECGELDDRHLLPINRYVTDVADSQDVPINEINEYERYTAKKLRSVVLVDRDYPDIVYLYSIKYSPSVFVQIGLSNVSVFDTTLSIGILLSKSIHKDKECIKFPIYLVGGKCTVEIKFEKSMTISYANWLLLSKSHESLFTLYSERIRNFDPNIFFKPQDSDCSFIVTILKNSEIDLDVIKRFVEKPQVVNLKENDQRTWIGSIVRPTHLKQEFGAFVVTEVCSDKNAFSVFPGSTKTVEQYYHDKYNMNFSISEKLLPLIKVQRLTTIISCINNKSSQYSTKLTKINNDDVYLIPSLSECISLPANLWTQLCIFPTLHYRLNQIFALEEFAHEIDFIDLENRSKCLEIDFDFCYNISNIESDKFYTDLTCFVQNIFPCFVSKACHDRTNLEQFEILGDSFLKYISSKYVYHFSEPADNEGRLTQKRSRLTSNSNLYKLAIIKGLDRFLFHTNFDPRVNYLPPCFVTEIQRIKKSRKDRSCMSFKNKSLADCVEAIIGSVLVNYGMDSATKFLLWLGVSLCPVEKFELDIEPISPLVLNTSLIDITIPCCISELEKILQYEFKYKAYAVQAITHPTSITNRKFSCYQRLEFLGDSVIDYLVTKHIMVNNEKLDSGNITNLRSALVNNNTFAYLSAKWEFHKFLNYFDSQMFALLPVVVGNLLENQLESYNAFLKQSEHYKVIVKVLGDIFESICGAIFLDCNYNLKTVWNIYHRLMEEPLKKFSAKIPKNKISMLHEKYPDLKCNFEIEEYTNLINMTAYLPDGVTIEKKERNKRLCKLALAEELNI